MEQSKEDPETWAPDDSIAKEKDVSSSLQKEEDGSHLDFEDNSKELLMEEEEVLIKPESNPPPESSDRKWSPRRDAFFFSKFVSFL